MKSINRRKREHVRIALEDETVDRRGGYFDRIRLFHRALPEVDLPKVDPSVEFLGKRLSFPLMIASMTGGADEELARINRNLAEAAEAEKVALAVGSQRVRLADEAARASFELRRYAPTVPLLANLGAVQLNRGVSVADCRRLVEEIGADALCLHLNPLQEALQPEGDTDFAGLADRIAEVVAGLDRPVIVKEVGTGLSPKDAELLFAAGVRWMDVAGSGGTSWSRIEGLRSEDAACAERFSDWGIPTPTALRLLAPFRKRGVRLIASGGLRSGIDMAKATVLGAELCGAALPFLAPAQESAEAVRAEIRRFRREFTIALFLLGAERADEIRGNEELICHEDRD